MNLGYVHGYHLEESHRLYDQAIDLNDILHANACYPVGCEILEIGCGVGAQTAILAKNNPQSHITAVDVSESSIQQARQFIAKQAINNVSFICQDLLHLSFEPDSFDHIFGSFVLEHVHQPVEILNVLKQKLRPEGTIMLIEGDHGSIHFFPESELASKAIQCQIDLQKNVGGNPSIGRELYPLLKKVGFEKIAVNPIAVYSAQDGIAQQSSGFVDKVFAPMIAGVRDSAVTAGMIDSDAFDQGIQDLYRTAQPGGVFGITLYSVTAKQR